MLRQSLMLANLVVINFLSLGGSFLMHKLLSIVATALLLLITSACNSSSTAVTGKAIKTQPIGSLTVTLATDDGQLKHGNEEIILSFTDAAGKAVEVGAVALNFHMPAMGTMAVMNDSATFTTTDTPGVYRGKVNLEMAGEWQTQISIEGSAGTAKTSFPVVAQ